MKKKRYTRTSPGKLSAVVAGLVALGLVVSACGSDSGGETGGSDAPATNSAGATETQTCIEKANAFVDEHKTAMDDRSALYPTQTGDGSLAKGKNFWVIGLTTAVPVLADYVEGFVQAGEALGAKVTVFDGQANPAVISQGFASAVAAKADAIVTVLVDPGSVASAVDEAQAAGIPIIGGDSGPADVLFESGLEAAVGVDAFAQGQWQMQAALAASDCDLNAMLMYTKGQPTSTTAHAGFTSVIEELCPETCKSYDIDIQAGDIASKAQTSVQNGLQRNPDTNQIIMVADPFYAYVDSALKALDKDLPVNTSASIGSLSGTGGFVKQAVVVPPGQAHGWFYMAGLLQVLAGETGVEMSFPMGLIDSTNRSSEDPSSFDASAPYDGYQDEFLKAWGVSAQ